MSQSENVLNSWKEISSYMGRGVRTVQRWEQEFGLPVRRPGGHIRGSVIAIRAEIDQWMTSRLLRRRAGPIPDKPPVCEREDCRLAREDLHRLRKQMDSLQKGAQRGADRGNRGESPNVA